MDPSTSKVAVSRPRSLLTATKLMTVGGKKILKWRPRHSIRSRGRLPTRPTDEPMLSYKRDTIMFVR